MTDTLTVKLGQVGNKRQRAAATRVLEAYAYKVREGKAPLYCMDIADEIVDAWLRAAPTSK